MKKRLMMLGLAVVLLLFAGCANERKVTLNVLNWGDYIDESVLEDFEKETGIAVNYNTFANNEEMLVQLSSGDNICDVCFPSDYIIEKMLKDDMLAQLDQSKMPNIKNIDMRFMDLPFDPANKYSVPYMWGTVGILYNTTMVEEPVDSWNILWNPKYSKQILMYDSIRDTIGITLMKLGKSINTRDEADIGAAEAALIEQKPLVLAYCGDDIKDKMIGGSAALALVYSGDAMYCMDENEDLAYAVPNEGSNVWFDNIVVPKSSKRVEEAQKFIDFLCRPDIAKRNAEFIGYSTPNTEALKLMGPEWTESETYNPPAEVIDRCKVFSDLGDFITVYNEAWLRIKAS